MAYLSVTHVAIRVTGLREAERSYRTIFGLQVAFRPGTIDVPIVDPLCASQYRFELSRSRPSKKRIALAGQPAKACTLFLGRCLARDVGWSS